MDDLESFMSSGGSHAAPQKQKRFSDDFLADSEGEAIYALSHGLAVRATLKGQQPDFSGGQKEDTDHLEDFISSGGTSSPVTKKEEVIPAPVVQERPQTSSALPANIPGYAASGVLGEAKGAFDTLIEGPAQLAAHAVADVYPKNWPGYEFFQKQKDIAETGMAAREASFKDITRNTETSAAIGSGAGNVIGAFALPQGKVEEGANLVNRMIAAAKSGAVIGLATPVKDASDFWTQKAFQTGVASAGAALFTPVAELAGKAIGATTNKATEIGQRVLNWFGGNASDDAVAAVMKNASPELQSAVKTAVNKGQSIDPAALGRQVEADSLPVKISLTAGQARQDPIAISNEMNFRSKNPAIVYKLQDQNRALIENLNHVRDTGAPEATAPDAISAGEHLIQAGKNVLDKQREMTTALYKKLTDANGGNLPIDGKTFVESAESALKKQMKAPFLPSEVRGLLDDFKSGAPMTFESFENLRTILAAEARSTSNGNTAAAVNLVRDALESTPISSDVSQVKQLADAARASAKYGFDLVRNNPALKAIDSGKAADNNFVQRYIIGASKKDISGLADVLQNDPVALQTIKAGTINYLKQAAGVALDNGNFTQAGYNKALQALGPKLDVIFGPEEATTIRTLGNVARYAQLAPKGSFVNASNTDVANLARTGADVAAGAVDRATGLPIGSIARGTVASLMEKKANAAELRKIVDVGAGVSTPSAANDFMARKFPQFAGQILTVPVAAVTAKTFTKEKP